MEQFLKVGTEVQTLDGSSVGTLTKIINEHPDCDNPRCIVFTDYPFDGAEIIEHMSNLKEYAPTKQEVIDNLPF